MTLEFAFARSFATLKGLAGCADTKDNLSNMVCSR
ncbi:hypothetical protein OOU_Y34scaffold00462g57 [Pyricularia oryzae Y34]|uniref:Uncharacterized protein n=3 Tax=Pyricularia oryzae TaxID=318829 RepID=A0A4P7NJF4_PYROR|nr:hypothetical protein OOU_Y34scaffold00462g57 [Pyricularia oryzae Y34]QBZ62174.1 hypothetical protein PoMZ_11050 [Pyricularia oryzae]